MDISIIM